MAGKPSPRLIKKLHRLTRPLNSSSPPIVDTPELNFLKKPEPHVAKPSEFNAGKDLILELDDTQKLFSSFSTGKLIRSAINVHVAAIEPVVDFGTWVMQSKLMDTFPVREIVLGTIRRTFFEHFCGGETAEEAKRNIEKLYDAGLRGMMVYGLEDADDNESCDKNLEMFLQTAEASKSLPRSSMSFVIVKITAICRVGLLERASTLLSWEHKNPSLKLPWKQETLTLFAANSPLYLTLNRPEPLTPQEEEDFQLAQQRLQKLCQRCAELDVPLAIDAEYTSVQPAIDYLTYSSSILYNKDSKPIVYGTMQAYLKDAKERLFLACKDAEKMGVSMAYKLVRGAYMTRDLKVASSLGCESPIHNNLQDTHRSYNDCASFMLDKIVDGSGALLLATHNLDSAKLVASKSKDLGIGSKNENLQFAQLYAMSEGLSFSLRDAGFLVSKYMPFGPIEKIIPYLLRRAEENRGFLSSSEMDRQLMRKELARRFLAAIS
ncbi:Proline dehydrogenase domain [Dillenia turbinata]|uniref:Proline dehydrogenase n=1 Tax=Dillenia turbinata TaxID=194707 RepID=A0AAN8UN55_9MAGN